jgi:glucose-6-phosphate isomerase
MSDLWTQLSRLQQNAKDLKTLFYEDADRFAEFSAAQGDLLLDYSKTHLTHETLSLLLELAAASRVAEKREAMFAGETINTTENRAVLHTALRNVSNTPVFADGIDVMPEINKTLDSVYAFAASVRSGQIAAADGKKFTDVINIGIGGSDLGPLMVTAALAPYHDGPKIHFVSNVDGAHLADTIKWLDPARTLIVVASKTFTTTETMTNAHSARRGKPQWQRILSRFRPHSTRWLRSGFSRTGFLVSGIGWAAGTRYGRRSGWLSSLRSALKISSGFWPVRMKWIYIFVPHLLQKTCPCCLH